eukprot:SAG25_NODE_7702_length_465_cov_0.587432_1_plen_78_part_10
MRQAVHPTIIQVRLADFALVDPLCLILGRQRQDAAVHVQTCKYRLAATGGNSAAGAQTCDARLLVLQFGLGQGLCVPP